VPVVSDASPLILYASVGRLALLHELFGEIVVPPAVWSEITAGGVGRRGAQEVESAPWIRQQAPLRSPAAHGLPGDLDAGEAEAIALAVEAVEPAGTRRAAPRPRLLMNGHASSGIGPLERSCNHERNAQVKFAIHFTIAHQAVPGGSQTTVPISDPRVMAGVRFRPVPQN